MSGIPELAFLVGTWRGQGEGSYPTIASFAYTEEVVIDPLPRPILSYRQRTADAATGDPRHAESGFLRLPDGTPELVIAQPTGVVECHAGVLEGQRLTLRSTVVGMTPSARSHRITEVHRTIWVEGDTMRYRLAMGAAGQPLTHHLGAELLRTV